MSAFRPFNLWSRRLAVYGYLAPLVSGKRVLEIGCAEGVGAARLAELGAESVVGADTNQALLARARSEASAPNLGFASLDRRSLGPAAPFDLIIVPEAASLLRPGNALNPSAARGLLGAQGRLVVMVGNGDRPGTTSGRGYYEVVEALEALFPRVRMFGVTPFAAYGLAEFAEQVAGLRIDGGLVEDASLQPTHYVALAGPDDEVELGYALMQVPFGPGDIEAATTASTPVGAGDSAGAEGDADLVQDLRRSLAEAQGQHEGVLRVSRAQVEEIEELRGRLRRGAEARAELDQEVVRLRKALAEADESVLDLTRRTREEMAALAQRITSGLRPETPAGRDQEQVQRALAARESSLSERDERIAALEADKQDLLWRLETATAAMSSARPATTASARPPAGAAAPQPARAQAVEQYRQAAAAHLQEVNRLREALAEQSTQVSELEDSLATAEEKLNTALAETAALRRHLAEVEDGDRGRRSRLAEVEGTLLRLQRQAAVAAAAQSNGSHGDGDGFGQAARQALEERLRQSEAARMETERRWQDAAARMAGLERALDEQAAAAAVAPPAQPAGAEVETALRELGRLREALERSEEQLWETKGQLLLDRERMAVLEHQVATTPAPTDASAGSSGTGEPTVTEAAHRAIVTSVLKELGEIEASVRQEVGRLDSIERLIEGWRADLAVTDADVDVSFTRVD